MMVLVSFVDQSVNTSKEEWTLGVVNEMMERRLLHPVTGGPQGSTSGTGEGNSILHSQFITGIYLNLIHVRCIVISCRITKLIFIIEFYVFCM